MITYLSKRRHALPVAAIAQSVPITADDAAFAVDDGVVVVVVVVAVPDIKNNVVGCEIGIGCRIIFDVRG